MRKLKLMTVVGTRPEVIKLSEIIKKADAYFDHTLVHTGQNFDYELNQVFFSELGLRDPDCYLDVVGKDLGETMGNVLSKSYQIMNQVKPDALLVLGDTNSCLCVISAKRLKIPIFHMEAGNRCFDENLPEEVNRRIVDTTSDVNLCYTEHARRYLSDTAFPPERTFVVGSPMREVIGAHEERIKASKVLEVLELQPGKFVLISAHREENIDNECNFTEMVNAINSVAEAYQVPVIYSMHPRARKIIDKREAVFHPLVRALKPFGFCDYAQLQKNALCVISDSGTLAEEAAVLGFPAVSLRTSTERPEAFDKGVLVLGDITVEGVLRATAMASQMDVSRVSPVSDYRDGFVSDGVVRIIQGYTGYVNRWVWNK